MPRMWRLTLGGSRDAQGTARHRDRLNGIPIAETEGLTMKSERRYSPEVVIRSQKRVLSLAVNTIGRMSKRQLRTLRPCGDGGVITLNELTEHLVAAIHLKVRR